MKYTRRFGTHARAVIFFIFACMGIYTASFVIAETIVYPYVLPSGKICSSFEGCRSYCISTEVTNLDAEACKIFGTSSGTPIATAATPPPTTTTTSTPPPSSVSTTTTTQSVPLAPSQLLLSHQNGSEVVLKWTDNSSNENFFKLMWRTATESSRELAIITTGTTFYTHHASVGSNYYTVTACNDIGCSAESNVLPVSVSSSTNTNDQNTTSTTTIAETAPPPATPPPAPSVLQSQTNTNLVPVMEEKPLNSVTISGSVVGVDGAVLAVGGYVEVFYEDTKLGKAAGAAFEGGKFLIQVATGNYYVKVFLPSGTGYTPSSPQKLIVANNTSVTFTATANLSILSGKIVNVADNTVAFGIYGRVVASSNNGAWQETSIASNGTYALKLGAGTWQVGIEIKSESGYVISGEKQFTVLMHAGADAEQNFIVEKAIVTLEGYILDQNGAGIGDVYVLVDEGQYSSDGIAVNQNFAGMVRKMTTDARGYFTTTVPPGTYFVRTFVRTDRGYINAKERQITALGSKMTVNMELQKPDVTISGFVSVNGTPISGAFVWAWSKEGGYQETISKSNGSYSLKVLPGSSWVVVAKAHVHDIEYAADEVAVGVSTGSSTYDINLQARKQLAKAAVLRSGANAPIVVTVASGGPTVVAPAGAFGSSGTIDIVVTPDTRAPSQGQARVVGTAYDFSAANVGGQGITSFSQDVVITLPYSEADVTAVGVSEKELVLSFWDEGVSAWKNLDTSIVNTVDNTVTGAVDHFTRFAVLAAADITPPEAPTAFTLSALEAGKIHISWVNPVKDFDHAKVYRSDKKDTLGAVIAGEVSDTKYVDETGLISGVVYYYTIRAVDPAGNESNNTTAAQITANGSSAVKSTVLALVPLPQAPPVALKVTGSITRTLKLGMSGADVSVLQRLLIQENVYPEAKVTGYFGNLTKAAVIRYQEKYMAEILTPLSLSKGTGVIGAKTRQKMSISLSN